MVKKRGQLLLFVFFTASFSYAQSPGAAIDVQHYGFNILLSDSTNQIDGKADIALTFLKKVDGFKIDLVKSDNKGNGMLVTAVVENGEQLKFSQDNDAVNISTHATAGTKHTYTITYKGVPADGLIISTNKFGHRTFFGDNWPNRAHNWLPCVDDPADKATVDFTVTAPGHYEVVANGLKIQETTLPTHLKLTHWKESVPIPTKVMVIGVADMAIDHAGDVNGIPVYSYVYPENKAAGFRDYAIAKDILTFFINKIGPYAYEKLANVQSKTIFGGMENASCIFYNESSVGDPDVEALIGHEVAHQWFGDDATETSFQHVWLSEGFATYMTNVYMENKYGKDVLQSRMKKDREKVLDFENSRLTPVVDTTVKSNFMQLLNANSYEKGSLVLHMLRHKLGDQVFWKGLSAYYARYKNGNANTDDLRQVMEQTSGQDLQQFFKQWLYTAGSPAISYSWYYDKAKRSLDVSVVQTQQTLFEFPLQIQVNGKLYTMPVRGKTSRLRIPIKAKPDTVIIDPQVNLLARFKNVNKSALKLKDMAE